VRMDESVRMLLGWLVGGERATSAYDGYPLSYAKAPSTLWPPHHP
jgi:hypothetical protein